MMRRYSDPVTIDPIETSASDAALLAFEVFRRWASTGRRIAEPTLIDVLQGSGSGTARVSPGDAEFILLNARNMRAIRRTLRLAGRPRVRHDLPACGVIESAHCDAIWGDLLIEYKAVRRSLGVRDLRQVLLYGALCWASAGWRPVAGVLVNPLSGEYVKLPYDRLSRVVSGLPFDELSRDIADYLVGLGLSG
jgi:hypothetical protein